MSKPIVSVIIPTYNRAEMVAKAIDSVLAQDFDGFEVIVSDDGSTDNTAQVLSKYDDKIRIVRGPNKGTATAMTRALQKAQGHLFAPLGSDDRMLPGRLTAQAKFMMAHPEVAAVTGNIVIQGQEQVNYLERCGINFNGQEWIIVERPFQKLIHKNFIADAASMIRTKYFLEVGGYDCSLRRAADWDLWLRVSRKFPLACMNMLCTWVGKHTGNQGIMSSPLHTASDMYIINRNLRCGEPIAPVILKDVRKRLWGLLKRYVRTNVKMQMPFEEKWQVRVRDCAVHLPWYQRGYLKLMAILPRRFSHHLLEQYTKVRATFHWLCNGKKEESA